MSAIVAKPALDAADLGGHSSGTCTAMNLRVPPSSAFSSSTACAMVPVPAKKSSTSDDPSVACSSTRFISFTGFGLSNTLPSISAARSLVPSSV